MAGDAVWLVLDAPTGAVVVPFWDRFLTSSGFAGVMAVVAASIAGFVAWRQLAEGKRQKAEDRWWETLTWVFDRSAGISPESKLLPSGIALSMLQALLDATATDKSALRKRAVGSLITMFALPIEESDTDTSVSVGDETYAASPQDADGAPGDFDGRGRRVVDESEADILEELRRSVADASPAAAEAVFEARVYNALLKVVEPRDGWHAVRHPLMPVGKPDFLLKTPSQTIVIQTKKARGAVSTATAAGWLGHLRKYVNGAGGRATGVLLCSEPLTPQAQREWASIASPSLNWVSWSGESEDLEQKLMPIIMPGEDH